MVTLLLIACEDVMVRVNTVPGSQVWWHVQYWEHVSLVSRAASDCLAKVVVE